MFYTQYNYILFIIVTYFIFIFCAHYFYSPIGTVSYVFDKHLKHTILDFGDSLRRTVNDFQNLIQSKMAGNAARKLSPISRNDL